MVAAGLACFCGSVFGRSLRELFKDSRQCGFRFAGYAGLVQNSGPLFGGQARLMSRSLSRKKKKKKKEKNLGNSFAPLRTFFFLRTHTHTLVIRLQPITSPHFPFIRMARMILDPFIISRVPSFFGISSACAILSPLTGAHIFPS